MRRGRQIYTLLWKSVDLLVLLIITGCAGINLPPAYIDPGRLVDDRPPQQLTSVLEVDLKPFESQLQDRTKVGTKRVGVNEIRGPLLATKDVVSVLQNSVITQLGLKGITVGQSALRLEGTVHEFCVDVDVDPATGRGKFRAVVRMELTAFDTGEQRQLWHEMYIGTAATSAPSVIDSAYERTLKVAFTNLLNQLRQDDSLLELRQLYHPLPPQPPPVAPQLPVVTSISARAGVAVPVKDAHAASVVPSEAAAAPAMTVVRAASSPGR